MKLEWFGQAGHFCAASKCRFHLHTHVNGYCVSTVGEYYPGGGERQDTVGLDRLYETMVFRILPDGAEVDYSDGLTCIGYNDRDAANAGHMAAVREWAERPKP